MKVFFKIFDKIEEIGMVLGMSVMVVVNFANVVSRYLMPNSPFSFTEELTVLLFVWITMLGISCGYRRFAHTGLSLITDMLPEKAQKGFVILGSLASIVMVGALFITGIAMVQGQIKYGQIMTALKIPEAVAGFSIPVGSTLILVRVVQAGILNITHFGKKEVEGSVNI